MAVTSLGLHQPIGLRYMIQENILPATPKPGSYRWQSYTSQVDGSTVQEEVISCDRCVVWSQGNSVRATYRFEIEGEAVAQSLLTTFPIASVNLKSNDIHSSELTAGKITPISVKKNQQSRALVVLLNTKLHIYFLQGTHHVVDLPFQIEQIFAAPHGILLQRTASKLPSLPPTPKPLSAPHNSFFSSQQTPNSSYLRSPTLNRRLANGVFSSQSENDTNVESSLDKLWKGIIASPSKDENIEEEALFSLTNPFSELSLITEAAPLLNFKLSRSQPSNNVDFIPLDAGETIVYVSPSDECPSQHSDNHGEFILIITSNKNTGMLNIWHAWYLKEQSLADLVRTRTRQKAEHARRRSSFVTVSHGTGANTPAVRRDGLRESMVAMSQQTKRTTRKASKQVDETSMASQLDPDFPTSTQQSDKDNNRRISSLVSRGELSMHDPRTSQIGASFTGQYRRQTSFGVPSERRSLGHRRSRGSTPGSILSRNVDDDMMDLDSQYGTDSDVADVLQCMRVASEGIGAESILGPLEDGWRRELVVRKIHAFDSESALTENIKVTTMRERLVTTKSTDDILHVYLHNRDANKVFHLILRVLQQPLFPDNTVITNVAIPIVEDHETYISADDILKLSTEDSEAVIVGRKEVRFAGSSESCATSSNKEYRLHDPLIALTQPSAEDAEFGKNRTITPPLDPITLEASGTSDTYIECATDGLAHRRRIYLGPSDAFTRQILSVCEIVLPPVVSQSIRPTWFVMHQSLQCEPDLLIGTCQSMEWIALAATIFSVICGLLDEKSRAALKVARMASRRQAGRSHGSLLKEQSTLKLRNKTVWSALSLQTRLGKVNRPKIAADQALPIAIALALDQGTAMKTSSFEEDAGIAIQLLLSLHVLYEEHKLDIGVSEMVKRTLLPPIIAQLGYWLNIEAWTATSTSYYGLEGATTDKWSYVKSTAYRHAAMEIMERPVGVFEWLENCLATTVPEAFPSLQQIAELHSSSSMPAALAIQAKHMTPRINMLDDLLMSTTSLGTSTHTIVEAMARCGITSAIIESLPAGIATPLREALTKSELAPTSTWPDHLLQLVGREDLTKDSSLREDNMRLPSKIDQPPHDINVVCHSIEHSSLPTKTKEADRNAISQLVFSEDCRFVHAASLLRFNTIQTAECEKQPDWSDAHYFDQQKRIMQFVTVRMIALPAGDALLHYDSQTPLMTEKYHLPGFSSSCIMQPNGHTVTTDRSALTEEKVNWAYFHAGVSSGLRISRQAVGIDTSWLVFNKPVELTNRHAGLLLALGLNGHLRNVAKWLSFKYLTPKHSMTSLGLLLGLAASNIGSMDGLITRMLSVHISCMLPPGAAELNVSPLTQTAGLLGIGLLYHDSQHRRMSEIMLHEVENLEIEDDDSGPDTLRDESYRLAAGLSLGIINIAHGSSLRGLHGLDLQDRLLRIAVGSRPVGAVHVFDKATAGAIMAIVLIFMKTNDTAVARRIDVPDTVHQFEHVRPDMLMLRTMAKHTILWDSIKASKNSNGQDTWISHNIPKCCKSKWFDLVNLTGTLRSSDLPLYYIVTGLAWAVSLKYAGSGNIDARNEILSCLNILTSLTRGKAKEAYYYDWKLAQAGLRRCTDVLALSAATIMAGTGDLQTFRFLRRLHGRTDSETPYGSHFAAHMAIGMLFMSGGTMTLGNSNLAIAALICSLYPLFPTDVQDNRVHLQAFRHLWVFAVESRCLVLEDIDTRRPLSIPVSIALQNGDLRFMQAPCLIPDISIIKNIKTTDTAFWPVTLDFSSNAARQAFSRNQVIQVRRCPAADSHTNAFWATFCALNIDPDKTSSMPDLSSWVLNRPELRVLDQNDVQLILPPDTRSSTYVDGKSMKADDRLILRQSARSDDRDQLWDMRVLLAWMRVRAGDSTVETRWMRKQDLQALESVIEDRRRQSRVGR